jgi:cytochrome P450
MVIFWHARRKGVAPAFSITNVKRVNDVALQRTERWTDETLIPPMKAGAPFDVAEERITITIDAVAKKLHLNTTYPKKRNMNLLHTKKV